MAAIDEIDITSLTLQEGSAPATPASTKWKLYTKTDGLYVKDDAGAETGPFAAGGAGAVATDAIWDAAGDLAVGTGADTAVKLAKGTALQRLQVNSGATALEWTSDPVDWALVPYYGTASVLAVHIGAANRAIYAPCILRSSATITGVRVVIGTSSGNLSVALYDGSGTRVATSGAVASPGTGRRDISFSGSYAATPGRYYLGVSADGTSLTFTMAVASGLVSTGVYYQETAHPCPATITSAGISNSMISMIGLVTGGYA